MSSLCKEKESLQLELKSMDKDKGNLVRKVFIVTVTRVQSCIRPIQSWIQDLP